MSMQVFRNSAKPLIYIVTASFFLWLVFDLSGLSGGTGLLSQTSAGKVDGQTIEARYYTTLVQQTIEEQQRTSSAPLTLDDIVGIRNDVWNQIVEATVLQREYKRRGLVATPRRSARPSRTSRRRSCRRRSSSRPRAQFDLSKYQRWLASGVGQQYIPMLEAQYRDQILQSKLLRVVTADVYLSDPALWQLYRDRNETATIELAAILPRRAIPDSAVQVSEAEIAGLLQGAPGPVHPAAHGVHELRGAAAADRRQRLRRGLPARPDRPRRRSSTARRSRKSPRGSRPTASRPRRAATSASGRRARWSRPSTTPPSRCPSTPCPCRCSPSSAIT